MPFTVDGKWVPSKKEEPHAKKITVLKQKRKGRTLTLIKNLDENQVDPQELLKLLKSKCHCGGALKDNILELQGDHEEKIKIILKQEKLL